MAFPEMTRQNMRQVSSGSAAYAAGARSTFELPRTGVITAFWLHVRGDIVQATAAGTLNVSGPWSLIKEIRLVANQGTEIIRLSGFAAHVRDILTNAKPHTPENRTGHAAAVGVATNTWDFWIRVPVTINERDAVGLILLQTLLMAAEVQVVWQNAGTTDANDEYTPILNTTGTSTVQSNMTVECWTEYFEIPGDPVDYPNIDMVNLVLENQQSISQTGEQVVRLAKADIYHRITHLIVINGALTSTVADLTRFRLRYNNNDTPYDMSGHFLRNRMFERYGRNLPVGVWVHDFMYQGVPGYGGSRDFVNADLVTELESVFDINTGVTIGTASVRTITERLVQLPEIQR